jgi:hypothetical protein
MATNLALDEDLLIERWKWSSWTKKDTVTLALKEFIARRTQKKILELFGTIDYDEKYDYKKIDQMKKVLVDTNIWSTVLRRNVSADDQIRNNLMQLVDEGRVGHYRSD